MVYVTATTDADGLLEAAVHELIGDDGVAVNVTAGSVTVTTSGQSLLLSSDELLTDDKVRVVTDSTTVTTLAYPSSAGSETLSDCVGKEPMASEKVTVKTLGCAPSLDPKEVGRTADV
jgi:hypothetical protein